MYYQFYEMSHAALAPWRAAADMTRLFYSNPINPIAHTDLGKQVAAYAEVFERMTRRYGKPEFTVTRTLVDGMAVPVNQRVVWKRPFCNLLHFERVMPEKRKQGPRILIVAPMSGHYATLAARHGRDHDPVCRRLHHRLGRRAHGADERGHVRSRRLCRLRHLDVAFPRHQHACHGRVPAFGAGACRRCADGGAPAIQHAPASMTLMGGPIDTRENPTAVNRLAETRDIDWFRDNVVMPVPFPHPGFMREVYPGFLQLSGFMSMNLDRHIMAHQDFFAHLVKGDGDSAEKHRDFYDEYLAVMDLDAAFYLQTVETVFMDHALPKGEMTHRGRPIDCTKIRNTALMTVEGENDDISGLGQTKAAHRLCTNLPRRQARPLHAAQVGHYGVFNGSRFRSEIAPRILDFMATHDRAIMPGRKAKAAK